MNRSGYPPRFAPQLTVEGGRIQKQTGPLQRILVGRSRRGEPRVHPVF
jgi:hypothetical protein